MPAKKLDPLPRIQDTGLTFMAYAEQELLRDPSLAVAPEREAVRAARSTGLRWERLAVYSGLSIAKVREMCDGLEGVGRSKPKPPAAGHNPTSEKPTPKPAAKRARPKRAA